MLKAVIFDLDGTLLNTLDDLADACNYALKACGYNTHPTEKYKTFLGGGLTSLINRALPADCDHERAYDDLVKIYRQYYAQHSTDKTYPYDGIIDMLNKLKASGLKLAVASNKSEEFMQKIVSKFFKNTFDVAEGHRINRPVKPDPSIILDIIKELDVSTQDVLYAGDSDSDMLAAKSAGVKSAGVLWGFRDREELTASGACYIARDAAELEKIIVSL